MYRTFAQVLPGFPREFQLSFPQVRAVQLLAEDSEHVRFGLVSPRLFPALLWVFANQEAQSLGVTAATGQHGGEGGRHQSFINSTVTRLSSKAALMGGREPEASGPPWGNLSHGTSNGRASGPLS